MSFVTFIETIKTKLKEILGGKVVAPAPKKGKKDKKRSGGKSEPKVKKETKGKKVPDGKTRK